MRIRYIVISLALVYTLISFAQSPMGDAETIAGMCIGFVLAGLLIYAWNRFWNRFKKRKGLD